METPRTAAMADSATTDPHTTYDLTGKSLLTAVLILISAIFLLLSAHAFARWYLLRRYRRRRDGGRRRLSFAPAPTPSSAGGGDRGLEASLLSSLPVLPFSASSDEYGPDECAVCLSEFEGDDHVRVLPRCAHTFHVECIDMWFYSHSTCPLCRSTVDPAVIPATTVSPQPSEICDLCRFEEEEQHVAAAPASASASSSNSTSASSLDSTDWNELGTVMYRQSPLVEVDEEEEKVFGGWIVAIKSILNWELAFHCGGGGGDLELGEGGGHRGRV